MWDGGLWVWQRKGGLKKKCRCVEGCSWIESVDTTRGHEAMTIRGRVAFLSGS